MGQPARAKIVDLAWILPAVVAKDKAGEQGPLVAWEDLSAMDKTPAQPVRERAQWIGPAADVDPRCLDPARQMAGRESDPERLGYGDKSPAHHHVFARQTRSQHRRSPTPPHDFDPTPTQPGLDPDTSGDRYRIPHDRHFDPIDGA